MKVVNTSTNKRLELAATPFAKGGEGALYKVLKPESAQGLVAKIYHPNKRSRQRLHKLRYLVQRPPKFDNHQQAALVAWPTAILEARGAFMGFLMPLAQGEPLEVLASSNIPKRLGRRWQRLDLSNDEALELRQKICFNIAVALFHIHATGNYVMVDLKPENILVQPNGLISLVDMDSIEIIDNYQLLFSAAVATPEFAPPEFHQGQAAKETFIPVEWDHFCMSVIFYKIMLGVHPFAASAKGKFAEAVTLSAKIMHGLYVHNKQKQSFLNLIPPPHERFFQLPAAVQYLFNLSFVQGLTQLTARPTAEDWCLVLGKDQINEQQLYFQFPEQRFQLQKLTLSWLDRNIFLEPFEEAMRPMLRKHKHTIINQLKDDWAKKQRLKFYWVDLVLGLAALFLFSYQWMMGLGLFLVLIGMIVLRKLRQGTPKNNQTVKWRGSNVEWTIPAYLKEGFLDWYATQEAQFKQHQLRYDARVEDYKQHLSELFDGWQKELLAAEKKCLDYNTAMRKQTAIVIKERNEQPLWQHYPGKNARQKINYLEHKFLPQLMKDSTLEKEKTIARIDKQHKIAWEKLEKSYHQQLKKIDQAFANDKQSVDKVAAKKKAEQRFVAKRQYIIDTLKKEKKAAEEHCATIQQQAKTNVKNYSQQLLAIEEETLNKKMTIERGYNKQFRKLLAQLEAEMSNKNKKILKLQEETTANYRQLVKTALPEQLAHKATE